MTIKALNPKEYIDKIEDPNKQKAIIQLREVINANLPTGFEEGILYDMIGYYVPHSLYPNGYHCTPALPLPFLNIAAQKNFVAIYHMGIYLDPELLEWFTISHQKSVPGKLDMGKSCIRYKNPDKIPYDLIGELVAKVSVDQWIALYESQLKTK